MPAKKNREVTAADVVKYARALLAKRGGWTKGCYARDSEGNAVHEARPEACSFCAKGAIYRAVHDLNPLQSVYHRAVAVFLADGEYSLIGFSDAQTTKAPVLRKFDKAIAKLEASNG